jgi:DNA-binding NtrC family response regulator
MQKIQILIICSHEEILQTIIRLINKNEKWNAIGAINSETAIKVFNQQTFDLVLLGSGIDNEDENKLQQIFLQKNPQIKIVQHFGGGSGLLFNEIEAALSDNANGNFNVIDNQFK